MKRLHLLFAALPVLAQTAASIPSPHQLRDEFEREMQPVWANAMRRLGLPSGFSPIRPSSEPLSCDPRDRCTAETIPLGSLDSHFVTVLKICAAAIDCRLIFFSNKGRDRWQILGHLDEQNDWGVTVAAQPPFVLVNGKNRAGSGVWANYDDWYEITPSGLRHVLRTLNQGHDVDATPALYFRGAFLNYKRYAAGESIDYLYRVACEEYASELELFDERRLVRFVRPKGTLEFKMDARRSELSAKEIDAFYFYDTEFSATDFLAFARNSLLRIARSGNAAQKQWLANYLAAAPASPIKSKLTRTLAARSEK